MTSRLTPEATAVYNAASNATDEETGARTARLPSLVFRTADRQGGTYHLTYTHSSHAHAARFASLQLMVLYPQTDSQGVYDTARTGDGRELVVQPLKCERAEGFQTEQLSIRLPEEVLTQYAMEGLRVRVIRADDNAAFSLDVPAAHLQALLALADDKSLHHWGAHDDAIEPSSTPPSLATPIATDVPPPLETPPALDMSQHERPTVAQHRRAPRRVTIASHWPIIAAVALIAGILAWRFWFSDGVTPIQPQPARTPPHAQNTQSAHVETAPKPSNTRSEPPPVADERTAARTFVEEWFKAVSSSKGARDAMRFYAPAVDYYQRGVVPVAYVQSDKAEFLQHWPIQNNTIEGEIIVTSEAEGSRVTFLFSYWLENGQQIRNGRARTLLVLQQRQGRYFIVRENTIALDAAGNAQNREFYWRHESAK